MHLGVSNNPSQKFLLSNLQVVIESRPKFAKLYNELILTLDGIFQPTRLAILIYDGESGTWSGGLAPIDNPRLVELGEKLIAAAASARANSTDSLFKSVGVVTSVKLIDSDTIKSFILLGPKKDGSSYSGKDKKLLSQVIKLVSPVFYSSWHARTKTTQHQDLRAQITELTKQLENTKQQLQELDEVKDEFISMASHQLRTPLTAIKGYLAMLLEGDAGELDDKQKSMVKAAFISSERMVYLIADFLNVSRLKTGKLTIDPKEVNLPKLIEEEMGQLSDIANSRGLKLIFNRPSQFPAVWLDENKTQQIVINLIENAVYFSQKDGTIQIDLKIDTQKIDFTVTDEGIGVPREDQPKLFNKFFRADNAKKARPDGTGLGLFMAKKVVIAQGGAVIYRDLHGKGSVFGFTFPLSAVTVPPNLEQTKTAP